MDLRPSPPHRSPLASMDDNQQNQRNQIDISFFSPGGRTTRAVSRKLRKIFQEGDDEAAKNPRKVSSSKAFPTPIDENGGKNADGIEVINRPTKSDEQETLSNVSTASKSKKLKSKTGTSVGRWETWERFEFLRGLRRHGKGRWKTIGESIPTRYVSFSINFVVDAIPESSCSPVHR